MTKKRRVKLLDHKVQEYKSLFNIIPIKLNIPCGVKVLGCITTKASFQIFKFPMLIIIKARATQYSITI